MEEKKLNEKESLEIITQMVNATKHVCDRGCGDSFVVWGTLSGGIAIFMWIMICLTHSGWWTFGWFAIPLLGWPITYIINKRRQPHVVTNLDKTIGNVWMVMGITFGVAMGVLAFLGWSSMNLMMPLALILCGVATCITGVIVKYRLLIFTPIISFGFGIYMLAEIVKTNNKMYLDWYWMFGVCFLVMMTLPGILLNKKAEKENV